MRRSVQRSRLAVSITMCASVIPALASTVSAGDTQLTCTEKTMLTLPNWQRFFDVCQAALRNPKLPPRRRTQVTYLRGYGHYAAGRYEAAEKDFRAVLKAERKHIGARIWLAQTLMYLRGDYKQATKILREAIAVDPSEPRPYYSLGILVADRGRHKEALKLYGQALERKPDYAWVRYRRSRLNLNLNRWEDVLTDTAYIMKNKGKFGIIAQADFYGRHIDLHIAATIRHAKALSGLTRYDEGEVLANELIANNPTAVTYFARAQFIAGLPFNAAKPLRYADIFSDIRKSIALDPTWAKTHHDLGYHLWRTGKPEQALEAITNALKIGRISYQTPYLYWDQAATLRTLKRTEAAIQAASTALTISSQLNYDFLTEKLSLLSDSGYLLPSSNQEELRDAVTNSLIACMHDERCY